MFLVYCFPQRQFGCLILKNWQENQNFNFGVKKMRSVRRKKFMKALLPFNGIIVAVIRLNDTNPQLEVIK
jgi:hypothetical protein